MATLSLHTFFLFYLVLVLWVPAKIFGLYVVHASLRRKSPPWGFSSAVVAVEAFDTKRPNAHFPKLFYTDSA